jgi:hypothetical protein
MLGRLIKYGLVAGITVLFAVMWGLTIRANLPAYSEFVIQPDYDRLLPEGEEERNEVWDIYFEMLRIGESELTVSREGDGSLLLHSRLRADVGAATQFITGSAGAFELDFHARVSPITGLTSFDAMSEMLDLQVFGNVRDGNLHLTGNLGADRIRATLPFDEKKVMGQLLSPMTALPELSEDQIDRPSVVELFNPLTGRMQDVTLTITGAQPIELEGEETTAFTLRAVMGRSRWNSWVTGDGDVLIQGTPFGLRLQKRGLPPGLVRELLDAARADDAADAVANP